VKGRAIADAARRGDLPRLENEIKSTLGDGTHQAQRLEALIRINGGVWCADGAWLDLSAVREVRSIVAGLDYFGPLSVGIVDLQEAGLLDPGSTPWLVSMADLAVVAEVLDRPTEFLLYVRRRTDSGVAQHFRAADELDLFMLFLSGGLYVAPDPTEVRRAHPATPPARRRDHRDHDRSARPTFVGTHTDPLDRWMYWVEGSSPFQAPKPAFRAPDDLLELTDWLGRGARPGWLRFGADLLGLSGDAQKQLLRQLDDLVDATRADGAFHTLAHGYAGMWGYPTFFAACHGAGMDTAAAVERLHIYMAAKKHQLRSDRSLGILLDEYGTRRAVIYLNDPPSADERLDSVGEAIGLDTSFTEPKRSPTNTARRDRARRTRHRRR
jgi:hypothetical protein